MAEVMTDEKAVISEAEQKVHYGEVKMPRDPETSRAIKHTKVAFCVGLVVAAGLGAAVALVEEDALDTSPDVVSLRADAALEAKDYVTAGSVDVQEHATLIRVPCTPYASGGRIFSFSPGQDNKKPIVSIQNAPFDIDADGQKFTSGESTLLKIDLNNSTETIAFLARATSHCPKPTVPSSNTAHESTRTPNSTVSTTTP